MRGALSTKCTRQRSLRKVDMQKDVMYSVIQGHCSLHFTVLCTLSKDANITFFSFSLQVRVFMISRPPAVSLFSGKEQVCIFFSIYVSASHTILTTPQVIRHVLWLDTRDLRGCNETPDWPSGNKGVEVYDHMFPGILFLARDASARDGMSLIQVRACCVKRVTHSDCILRYISLFFWWP